MRTARSSSRHGGVLHTPSPGAVIPPGADPPEQAPPRAGTPPGADPPEQVS